MKRKTTIEDDPEKVVIKSYVKFVKCVYNGLVNVNNAPSGKKYSFMPGQVAKITTPEDYHHLINLQRGPGPGCCGGAEAQARTYFEAVEMED